MSFSARALTLIAAARISGCWNVSATACAASSESISLRLHHTFALGNFTSMPIEPSQRVVT